MVFALYLLNCILGSLIKHQLVTHLTLGIALRGVLDALRKPTDSKVSINFSIFFLPLFSFHVCHPYVFYCQIFTFGTKALEQFLDRLIEWPQYCYHILQISHLRGTHPELVAFIERALARTSSSHSESNVGNNSSTDPHSGSASATLENVEV